jgi:DNA-binding winged helix-turn-helix (wHTH) protein
MGSQEFSTPVEPPSSAGMRRFGAFRLDPAGRVLLCNGRPVALPPRAFDVLALLVANRGRVVAKEEFFATLWAQQPVEEGNLTQYIFLLRRALGDSRGRPRYIQTVAGRGYRFAAEPRPAASEPRIVAVAPLASDDRNRASGLTEAIASALGGVPGVAVLPAIAAAPRNPVAFARGAGAALLVQASLRRSGGRLRAVAQLVDAESGAIAWARRFDGAASCLFHLEDRVARAAARAVAERTAGGAAMCVPEPAIVSPG